MKRLLLSAVIAVLGMIQFSNAALLIYNDTINVDSDGELFSFNQFNPALGTLTAIDLLINSSVPSGSALVTNNSHSANVTIRHIRSTLEIDPDAGLGFAGYTGPIVDLNTNPIAKFPSAFVLAPSASQVFSMDSSQSLIGGATQEFSISSGSFGSYLGGGTVSFFGLATITLNTIGTTFAVDSTSYYSLTNASLRYTYTPSSPVPEPGQVAASLVLLGVGGFYWFLASSRKRSRSSGS